MYKRQPPWQWIHPTIKNYTRRQHNKTKHWPVNSACYTTTNNSRKLQPICPHLYRGSMDTQRNKLGAGYFIPSTQEFFLVPANSCSSVDTELLAINAALTYCLTLNNKKVCIFTDAQAALLLLQQYKPSAYYFRTVHIIKILEWNKTELTLQWIPSHVNICLLYTSRCV